MTVFVINIAAKLILDVISVVAGGTTSGATSSLLLAAGLMLAGEAAVVCLRVQGGQPSVRREASRLAEGLLNRLADRRTEV